MVTVVVAVRMVVVDRCVLVPVGMALGHVEVDARPEQRRRGERPRSRPALAERDGDGGADERRQREHRAGAPGADAALPMPDQRPCYRNPMHAEQASLDVRPSGGRTPALDISPVRPILARVIERWHPLAIWLFGSRARGDARPDSDWDLLAIVADCPEPADFDDPMTVWRVKREPGVHSDLVLYRASEFEEDRTVPNTLAYSTVIDGVLLYER